MSVPRDLIEDLLARKADANARYAVIKGLEAKVRDALLEDFGADGIDRIRTEAGTVTVVVPSPQVLVNDADMVCDWLIDAGWPELVDVRAEVVHHDALVSLLARHQPDDPIMQADFAAHVRIVRAPLGGWNDEVGLVERNGGLMDPTSGEVVPGVEVLHPSPSSIRCVPAKAVKDAAVAGVPK